jgi:hypothetical protein
VCSSDLVFGEGQDETGSELGKSPGLAAGAAAGALDKTLDGLGEIHRIRWQQRERGGFHKNGF